MRGFQIFSTVKDKNKGAGLCVGIRHGLYQSVMAESSDNAQFITVHLNGTNNTYSTRLILAYGLQENELDDDKTYFIRIYLCRLKRHL